MNDENIPAETADSEANNQNILSREVVVTICLYGGITTLMRFLSETGRNIVLAACLILTVIVFYQFKNFRKPILLVCGLMIFIFAPVFLLKHFFG